MACGRGMSFNISSRDLRAHLRFAGAQRPARQLWMMRTSRGLEIDDGNLSIIIDGLVRRADLIELVMGYEAKDFKRVIQL